MFDAGITIIIILIIFIIIFFIISILQNKKHKFIFSLSGGNNIDDIKTYFNTFKFTILNKAINCNISIPYSTKRIEDKRNGYDFNHSVLILKNDKQIMHNLEITSIKNDFAKIDDIFIYVLITPGEEEIERSKKMGYEPIYIAICSHKNDIIDFLNNNINSIEELINFTSSNDEIFCVLIERIDYVSMYEAGQNEIYDIKGYTCAGKGLFEISDINFKSSIDEMIKCLKSIDIGNTIYYINMDQKRMIYLTVKENMDYYSIVKHDILPNIVKFYTNRMQLLKTLNGFMNALLFGIQ